MKTTRTAQVLSVLTLVAALCLLPTAAPAQLNSNIGVVNLNAAVAESLTVTVTGGSTVNFTLIPGGTVNGDMPAVIQTSWVLNPSVGNVDLIGYFTTTTAALTDGAGNDIPSANVLGQVTTGKPKTYTAFTEINVLGPAGGSLLLFSEKIGKKNQTDTRNDNLDLQIDLTSLPLLPAGTYTGTLNIRAQAL